MSGDTIFVGGTPSSNPVIPPSSNPIAGPSSFVDPAAQQSSMFPVDVSAGAVTITLPAAITTGIQKAVKCIAGNPAINNITVNAGGGHTIENPFSPGTYASSVVISQNANAAFVATWVFDGTAFRCINFPSSSPRITPTDSHTLLQWLFGEATGGPWANTGTLGALNMTHGVTGPVSRTGLFNNCLDFAKLSSQTTLTANTALGSTITNALTVSCWVNFRTDSAVGHIFNKEYRNDGTWLAPFDVFGFFMQGTSDGAWAATVTTAATLHTLNVGSPFGIPKAQWSLIHLTYDGVTLSAGLDGTIGATVGVTGNVDFGTNGAYQAGGVNPTAVQYYDGLLQDIRVENTVRSAAYLQNMYKQGLGLLDP